MVRKKRQPTISSGARVCRICAGSGRQFQLVSKLLN